MAIFVSYARPDRDAALTLYDQLKKEGFSVWIDAHNLLPGTEWEFEISRTIRQSDVFLACLSRNSVMRRGFVQSELKKALKVLDTIPEGQIFLIPVKLDNCEIPESLSHLHWVNLFEEDGLTTLIYALRHFYATKDQVNNDLALTSEPLTFSLIRISRNDDNWIEAPEAGIFQDVTFNNKAKHHFRLDKFVYRADMSLDVTLLNLAPSPKILDSLGVEILEAQHVMYVYGIPEAAKIKLSEEYVLEIPLIRGKRYLKTSESSHSPVDLPTKITLQIPDPIYMEPKAAYRYGLKLKDYQVNVPNHAILRLLAKTQNEESYSEPIRTFTW